VSDIIVLIFLAVVCWLGYQTWRWRRRPVRILSVPALPTKETTNARIFVSYRREDSEGHAGRIRDRLAQEFGPDLLFMDVDSIKLGANFVKALREEVSKCDALLALIGPDWLVAKDRDGKRRLDDPNDFVRIEIASALQRDIPVIPILLQGARIPESKDLPPDLTELTLRNGLEVRHASFQGDMDKLIRGLKAQLD
jgi:hypothetical protein